MKLSDRLLERLRRDLPPGTLGLFVHIVRTRREQHAVRWAWYVANHRGMDLRIGSQNTIMQCVRAVDLTYSHDCAGRLHVEAHDSEVVY